MLASGDPFWFGAGTSLTKLLGDGEWVAFPAPSTFAIAAARLGWAIEATVCLGLHAAPHARLRPHLARGVRAIVLVRDGDDASALARAVAGWGFGESRLTVLEALGGARERVRRATAKAFALADIARPVAVAIDVAGDGTAPTRASGIADAWFAHDGQLTRRPARALTLSALAPRPGERLWDIGAGAGSIAIEWLLAHPSTQAIAFERDAARAERIAGNAAALGVDRLAIVRGEAPASLAGTPRPDAIFVGGGLSADLVAWLRANMAPGTRIVANAVTMESEALLVALHRDHGGDLLRIELSEPAAIGRRRAWRAGWPLVQWSGTL